MASIFRSEPLTLCEFYLSSEAAYDCIAELGNIGLVQFRDLNPDVNAYMRKFIHAVRRCDDVERQLLFIKSEILKRDVPLLPPKMDMDVPQPKSVTQMEATFEKMESELKEINRNMISLARNYDDLVELKHVLEAAQTFLRHNEPGMAVDLTDQLLKHEEGRGSAQISFVSGIIRRERVQSFETMIWRVSRGNALMKQFHLDEPFKDEATGKDVYKVVYLIFFQGEQLKKKVQKICEGYRSTVYPCPDTYEDRTAMLAHVKSRINDLNIILKESEDHRYQVLTNAGKVIADWILKVHKIKAIYHTMNMFNVDVTNKCFIGEGWVPTSDLSTILAALKKGALKSGTSLQPIMNTVDTNEQPPCFFRRNKFTKGFQNLIDAYAISTYREINPGLYTIATFPFLFAIMFGDAGHGIIMFLFGLWMVLWEKPLLARRSSNEIWNMFLAGRYLLLMMGLFSMYTGTIYNDIFSKSFNIFGSHWHTGNLTSSYVLDDKDAEVSLNPGDEEDYEGNPYPLGFDPIWQISVNKIAFQNSFKMKLSIILGVAHMLFGVVLSIINHVYFRRGLNVFFEFIPQVFFLMCLFGYLCFMVFWKWANYGDGPEFDKPHRSYCAPSILITFINMMLINKEDELKDEKCLSNYMFSWQHTLQYVLFALAIISIPVLLLPKPFILKFRNKRKERALETMTDGEDEEKLRRIRLKVDKYPTGEEGAEFEFSEVFIHQAIHTIEYVLGSISHTASYLRLWALSLAHAQLSEVLWMMVLSIGLSQKSTATGTIMLYLLFAVWAALTLAILVLMEGLSAFLHTLRLHWVEFCSKFYEGHGTKFTPFNFKHFVPDDADK